MTVPPQTQPSDMLRRRAWECALVLTDHELSVQHRIAVEVAAIGGPNRLALNEAGELICIAAATLGHRT